MPLFVRSLRVMFVVGCAGASPGRAPARCERGQCAESYACHYERERDRGAKDVCRPEVGRCRAALDCGMTQYCRRFSERMGTCVERGF